MNNLNQAVEMNCNLLSVTKKIILFQSKIFGFNENIGVILCEW